MKRELKTISTIKWYHIGTLIKYFSGYEMISKTCTDSLGKEFENVKFKKHWKVVYFIVHPKTGRLRFWDTKALNEAGWTF